jgi:hypothetical protein
VKPILTEADYRLAAKELGVPVAAVKAVCEVEAPKGGFFPDGQVRILFERHKFSRHTGGRYDNTHPGISNPSWGGYGAESVQHGRLQKAAALDRDAALKSASWGKFQILGENYEQAGFRTLQAFINAMSAGESEQLEAFVAFVKADKRLHAALVARDWVRFARIYNGPAYAKNAYHTKLAAAFERYSHDPDFSPVTSSVTSTEDPL